MSNQDDCHHPNYVEDGNELYCPDCNTYFSKLELKRKYEMECESCGNVIGIHEICWCRG